MEGFENMEEDFEKIETIEDISDMNENQLDVSESDWMEGLSISELEDAKSALLEYNEKTEKFDDFIDTLSKDELYELRDALDNDDEGEPKVLKM